MHFRVAPWQCVGVKMFSPSLIFLSFFSIIFSEFGMNNDEE